MKKKQYSRPVAIRAGIVTEGVMADSLQVKLGHSLQYTDYIDEPDILEGEIELN
jgi:hypothetical protein